MRQGKGIFAVFFTAAIGMLAAASLLAGGCAETSMTVVTQTRTTIPPDVQGDAASISPSISGDGRLVVFKSNAINLVVGKTNGASSIYLKDTRTGETRRVSSTSDDVIGNKDSDNPVISANGRFVAFNSISTNLVPGDTNSQCVSASGTNMNCPDVFIKDLDSGVLKLVSASAAGAQGGGESVRPAISSDGRFVAFVSTAPDLVPGDTNGKADIFLKDMQTGAITLISAAADGTQADDDSLAPSISADGRLVAFESASGSLAGGGNGRSQVYLKDSQTGALTLASTSADGAISDGASGDGSLAISGNGRFIAFDSGATNLAPEDGNGKRDIFIKDTQTGATSMVSTAATGSQGSQDSYKNVALSADGRFVAFSSDAPDLVPGDTNAASGKTDIFLKDTQTGAITLISSSSGGAAQGIGRSEPVSISADGRFVAFSSEAANLVPGDTNNKSDVFLKDTKTGATTRISTSTADLEAGTEGAGESTTGS